MWTAWGQQLVEEDCTLQHFNECSKGGGAALAPVLSQCLGIYVPDRVIQSAFHKELTSLPTCKFTPTPNAMSVLLSIEQISI